jgi:hypothetical protein
VRSIALLSALACGCASASGASPRSPGPARPEAERPEPTRPEAARAEPAHGEAAAPEPPPVPAERRCAASTDDRTFRFIAPSGGAAFGAEILAGTEAVTCCLTEGAYRPVDPSATVHFAVVDDEDRAQGRLHGVEGLDDEERRCLSRLVAGWQIVPAPRSDVCVRSFDPFGPACTFPTAAVTVRLPLPRRVIARRD